MPTDDAHRWSAIADVFDAVVDLPAADQADALDRLCRTPDGDLDAVLRAEVASLLDADAAASTDASFEIADAAALLDGHAPRVGERVGPWRVLRTIGRGGMGRVDLVERADGAYEMQAALKRLGLVAPSHVRRFLRERQILASLRHPGIARLLDGGVAEGAPYLVMEYVDGEPITAYAERHGLRLRDRLALFLQVCDAVDYAHRRLIVHRDLKPSNVLVSERPPDPEGGTKDGPEAGRVTLLNFGVARLLAPDAHDPITAEGPGAPLTPGYAAPEQIDGGEITTATDVWALGVLLYELVTGRLPFPTHSRDAWAEAVRRAAPTLPSEVARTARTTTSPADARRLRGDLDAICLTALRREPDARYASGHDLAADLRRHLAGEPVDARRPSPWYRIQRFAGRHRAGVGTTAVALLAVAAGVAFYTVRLATERDRAERSAVRAERTADFLETLFAASDATGAVAPGDMTARALLDAGAAQARQELAEEPVVLAQMLATIGRAYRTAGLYAEAEPALRDAVALYDSTGEDPLGHRDALLQLANLQYRTETYDQAQRFARAALRLDSLHARPEDSERLDILNTIGLILSDTGELEDAARVLEEVVAGRRALDSEEARVDLSVNLSNLGLIHLDLGHLDRAEALFDESIALIEALRGPDHVYVAYALNSRAGVHQARGDLAAAIADQQRSIVIGEASLGPDHPFLDYARGNLADLGARRDALAR